MHRCGPRYRKQTHRPEVLSLGFGRLLRFGGERRSEDTENEREPDQPHGHLGRGRFPGSLTEGLRLRAPAVDNHRPARARHPDAIVLDGTVQLAAASVFLREGGERGETERCSQKLAALVEQAYSMTRSARTSTDGGIVRPSAFAVLRLIANSNFVGCSTGRSAGLAPLRILST